MHKMQKLIALIGGSKFKAHGSSYNGQSPKTLPMQP